MIENSANWNRRGDKYCVTRTTELPSGDNRAPITNNWLEIYQPQTIEGLGQEEFQRQIDSYKAAAKRAKARKQGNK